MDINEVRLRGNLGQDPTIFEAKGEQPAMATFRLATKKRYRDRNEKIVDRTEWHNVVTYDWCVEVVRTLRSGAKVHLEGYKRTREYESTEGKGSIVEIVAVDLHEVKFAPRSERRDEQSSTQNAVTASTAEPNYH